MECLRLHFLYFFLSTLALIHICRRKSSWWQNVKLLKSAVECYFFCYQYLLSILFSILSSILLLFFLSILFQFMCTENCLYHFFFVVPIFKCSLFSAFNENIPFKTTMKLWNNNNRSFVVILNLYAPVKKQISISNRKKFFFYKTAIAVITYLIRLIWNV